MLTLAFDTATEVATSALVADGEVSHLDLYRFEGVSAAEWGDLEPYFDRSIAFVEWPEAGEGVLPPARFSVRLRHAGGARRVVSIDEC